MWSLGVLLMEVACGLRSVEHSLLACMPDRGASGTEQKMLLPTQEIAQDVQEPPQSLTSPSAASPVPHLPLLWSRCDSMG